MRILQLFRSVDLARTLRTASIVDGKYYILVMRKGKKSYQWERIISIPEFPRISPWHLLITHVTLTANVCQKGSLLLRSLIPPYEPLTSNAIGALTKKLLRRHGIPDEWAAHSTRGAGVTFYKTLGMSSEEVCEIGQWKNVQAFNTHYVRIGAADAAAAKIWQEVHTASLLGSAEPEVSWTPGNIGDPGGNDTEGEAQDNNEAHFTFAGVVLRWLEKKR